MAASQYPGDWRRELKRSIGWTLLLKAIALLALWALFFSPAHRLDLTPGGVESRLEIGTDVEPVHD
jgi:hypothetical protein